MIRLAHILFFIVLVSTAYAEGTATDFCELFFDECVLRFEGQDSLSTFDLAGTTDNVAFTPAVLFPGEDVGIGNLNGVIPQFIESAPSGIMAINVTEFGLSPTQFKPFTIVNSANSGIGHETFQSGIGVAQGGGGDVVDNPVAGPEDDDICVVFRTS
ncbi:hypothetical protein FGB62_145g09 [Gracilaria domingensis]|nr:hypothetical protein FGB62_145g09 [Gracilaria domingensis]